jgi:Flp pilus assembly secretin CpaC
MTRRKLQFRIGTLLWLTLCVAAFFGGRYWDQIAVAKRAEPVIVPFSPARLRLSAGTTTIVKTRLAVQRLVVNDPAIASIVPDTQNSFAVKAKQPGKTTIHVCDDSAYKVVTYEVTVQ